MVRALWIDYGQPSALAEEQAIEQIAEHYQLPLQKVHVRGITWPKLGNELIEYRGRNLTLVSLALNTTTIEPGLVALGIHRGTTFSDCSAAFSEQLNNLLILLSDGLLRLDCPFLNWSKQDIFEYAIANAVPVDLTYSCERGLLPPCKECVKCRDMEAILSATQPTSVTSGKEPYSSK
jgi:7-cyano-7-deazaguanine synthase